MGLSASQVRLLSLTARQHTTEYQAQRLQAQKLQLANESHAVYNKYLEKLDATKIQYKIVASDGSYTWNDATFAKMAQQGFLFNVNGTICNNWDPGVRQALQAQGIDVSAGDSTTLLSTLIQEGLVVIMEQKSDSEENWTYDITSAQLLYQDPLNMNPTEENPNPVPYSINDVGNYEKVYKVFGETSLGSSTKIQEISDETGLKKAESEYEADMNRINAKDARYDNELSQLETERQAIKTEMDQLKSVAKENVERTFKLFG